MSDSPETTGAAAIAAALAAVRTQIRDGRLTDAEEALKPLHWQHRQDPDIAALLGEVLRRQRKLIAANAILQTTLDKHESHIGARYYLGLVQAMQGDDSAAMITLNAVLDSESEHVGALHNLGVLHDRAGQYEQAEHFYRRALHQKPDNTPTRRNLASLLLDHGELDNAKTLYGEIIRANAKDVDAHFAYARLTTYDERDPTLPALQSLNQPIERMHWLQQVKYCFAMAKAQDDLGHYSTAAAALKIGNALHFERRPFDANDHQLLIDDLTQCFDSAFFARFLPLDHEGATPIFIVGMPRTGTTLIEQMLCSHSDITTAGEVGYLARAIQANLINRRGTFANAMPQWTQAMLENTADTYLRSLERHNSEGYRFIVDRTPANYRFIGLIRTLFPDALIIHQQRDPMATLWSCYATHFRDGYRYTYDLPTLATYYQSHRQLMQHWVDVVPQAGLHEVVYEEVVQAPEATLTPLLDRLSLQLEPECLAFHQHRRKVRSASAVMVRRPLYQRSLAHWQHYSDDLAPVSWVTQ